MKIIKTKHLHLSQTEFVEFLKQLLVIFNKYDATKLKVKNAVTALGTIITLLQAALDKEKSNQLTKTLDALDQQRDILIRAFVKYLDAMTDFPVKATADAATEMLHYVDGFGKNIAGQSNLAETTVLTNITDGFTTNVARKTALEAMGGTPWITALSNINTEYSTQYGKRIATDSTTDKIESFGTVRKKATTLYKALLDLLTNRYGSDKEDKADVSLYEACIADINTLAAKINALVAVSKAPGTVTAAAPAAS